MGNSDNGDLKNMKSFGFGARGVGALGLGALGLGAVSWRALMACAAVSVAFSVHAVPAYAGDDDDDDEPSIEQKVIHGIMHGIGAVDGTEKGIDYRERSPLVVPPKLDLPPPETRAAAPAPNWPKDPEIEEARKQRRAEKKRDKSQEGWALTPEEMKVGTARVKSATNSDQPGNPYSAGSDEAILSPSKLGFKGFGNIFSSSDKPESAPFPGEPARESLTQPPTGYQTPSPAYSYGLNGDDQKRAGNRSYDPKGEGDIVSQGRK
jgi:type IV secretory pathway VirB10-like protein